MAVSVNWGRGPFGGCTENKSPSIWRACIKAPDFLEAPTWYMVGPKSRSYVLTLGLCMYHIGIWILGDY